MLTRYSPARRPKRTRYHLTATATRLPFVSLPLCLLCIVPVLQLWMLRWGPRVLVGAAPLCLNCSEEFSVLNGLTGNLALSAGWSVL